MNEDLPSRMSGGPGMRGPARTVTAKEAKQRRTALTDLMANGLSHDEIVEQMSTKFNMTEEEVERLVPKVRAQILTEYDEAGPLHKAMASRRIHRHIISAQGARQWGAVANLEAQLSKIQGTESPTEQHITVDARLQQATLQVLGTLSPAQVQELVNEELRRISPQAPSQIVQASREPDRSET